jgi:hypothetical protein
VGRRRRWEDEEAGAEGCGGGCHSCHLVSFVFEPFLIFRSLHFFFLIFFPFAISSIHFWARVKIWARRSRWWALPNSWPQARSERE